MTLPGIVHNATWAQSRLTVADARMLRVGTARTITYYRDDETSWRATLEACQQLAAIGVKNLILANTEALGKILKDISGAQRRLEEFLTIASREYGLPIDAVEPINEGDTPGWTDGAGGPITAQLCADVTHAYLDVCRQYGVETIGPSFLGGPTSDLVRDTFTLLAHAGRVKVGAMHFYGRSIADEPKPGWIWGSVEQALADMDPFLGNMQIDITEGGCWTIADRLGEDAQARYVEALCNFQHPRVRRHYYFAINDHVVPEGELQQGKDWGLVRRNGTMKQAYSAFDGGFTAASPGPIVIPGDGNIGQGFRTWQAREPQIVGTFTDPREFGPWPGQSAIRTTRGWLMWSNLAGTGGALSFFGDGGERYRWAESWPKSERIAA